MTVVMAACSLAGCAKEQGMAGQTNVIKLISIFVWLDFIYRGLTIFFQKRLT